VGGTHSRSGCGVKRGKFLSLLGVEFCFLSTASDIMIELSWQCTCQLTNKVLSTVRIVTCRGYSRGGFALDIGFIDHLYTRLGTTSSDSATVNPHNSQITIAPVKRFPACSIFTSRSLATAITVEILQVYALRSSLHRLPYRTDFKVKVTLRLTVSQSVSKSWCRAYCLTVTVLFLWGALSDERTGLSFVYAAGPCQRSLSRVRVP
jgi:hypothetical protein